MASNFLVVEMLCPLMRGPSDPNWRGKLEKQRRRKAGVQRRVESRNANKDKGGRGREGSTSALVTSRFRAITLHQPWATPSAKSPGEDPQLKEASKDEPGLWRASWMKGVTNST
eukprot:TRINITY_DN3600_c0_g5_i1.p1 TRINITY_DN3600_c0_g5~~TRINITY_DN3600_c0_g5_i1.p1  ORF type:complete len:114 (+),score=23.72 TRINITY_DN3600_c0_g5_i1:492-833(+)